MLCVSSKSIVHMVWIMLRSMLGLTGGSELVGFGQTVMLIMNRGLHGNSEGHEVGYGEKLGL